MPTPLNACTIVSKNYICYARVLCDSFLAAHPEGRFFVLLVDRNDGYIDAEAERFTLFEAEDLPNIPHLQGFLFKYTLLECNTAVKPFFLEHLIQGYELPNLVYFDPDILITGCLDELASLVERHSVVLTPHLTDPIDDDAYPNEQAILQSGSYNLGFVAFRASEVGLKVIRWWQDRLYDKCVVRIADGLFVDQKWMDLVPGMFGGMDGEVCIHAHPGYNVAYWNLHGRTVELGPNGPTSNGYPLIFFHFSGIRPESLDGVSKHQDRFQLSDIGGAAELYREYAAKVIAAGYHDCVPWPYAFGVFDNGVRIPDAARSLFLGLDASEQGRFGNPFAAAGDDSFFSWLNRPAVGKKPTRLLHYLYHSRSDLHFGDIGSAAGAAAYGQWLREYGRHELKLDDALLTGLGDEPKDWLSPAGLKRRARHTLKRIYRSPVGHAAKATLKKSLGHERTRRLKERLRPAPPAASAARAAGPAWDVSSLGLNVVGYLDAETGMGEAGRSMVRACRAAGIPVSPHALDLGVVARRKHGELAGATSDFPHDVNLFVVNADQAAPVHEHLGAAVFGGRYNIGLWLWELETFPRSLAGSFKYFQEIWTPSTFCVDAIGAVSPVPVRRVPLPICDGTEAPAATGSSDVRRRLGLPEEAFLFLFMFNYLSYAERKNPVATVRAFRRAFGDDPSKALVLKTSQKDFAPQEHAALSAEIGEASNIHSLDEYLSAEDVAALTATADAYVSLHRSEGFGLTLAEAMLHHKPVIATPYSGVTDFFNLNNGFPVRYALQTLTEPVGPYAAGSRWADPDVEHAASQMRRVCEDETARRDIVQRAAADVRTQLSYGAVGERMKGLLESILRRSGARKDLSMPY